MFKKPSKVFEDLINKGRTTMVALKDFTPLQGGIPIVVGGQIVGGVGVSGASSAQQDEESAIAGAQAASEFTVGAMKSGPATTGYFAKDRVDAAFDKVPSSLNDQKAEILRLTRAVAAPPVP